MRHMIEHNFMKVSNIAEYLFIYFVLIEKPQNPDSCATVSPQRNVSGQAGFSSHLAWLWSRYIKDLRCFLHVYGSATTAVYTQEPVRVSFREPRLTGGFVFGSGRRIPICQRPRCRAWLWPDRQPSTWS